MKKPFFVFLFFLLLPLFELSAQQVFSDIDKGVNLRGDMVAPFSTQTPIDVYQQRHVHHFNIKVEYHRRDNVSRPVRCDHDIVTGWENQRVDNRLTIGSSSVSYYTQTPKMVDAAVAEKVAYNSFPTIDSKGEVISEGVEDAVVETGMKQALPSDWSEPGMPIGDFVFPMLLLVGFYFSFLVINGFKN